MKRFLRNSIPISVIVTVFVALPALFFAPSVLAAGNNGSQTTAYRKLWYSALSYCIKEYDAWYFDALEGGFMGIGADMVISSDHVRNGQWFATAWSVDWSLTYATSWGGGAYVEKAVDGKYDDGKIWCGEDDNALVSKGLEMLQVSKLDVACDYADGHFSSGVFYTDKTKQACVDKYNGGDDIYLNTGRGDYFKRLITQKTFGGNVPAGGLDSITSLEEYYIKKVTFETACATGEPHFGHKMDYNTVAWNPATNKFEEAGYSQKNSGNHSVYWWGGHSATCQELANSLNKGSSVFNAYRDEKLQDAKDGCVGEYDAELRKIKDYYDTYTKITSVGVNFVSTISHMLDGLTNGKITPLTYVGAQPAETLSPPLAESFISYIDNQLSAVLDGKINGVLIYPENVFNQLAEAAKSVLLHSNISDDGTVNSKAKDEDIEQAKDWVEKVNDTVTVVLENRNSLDSFIKSHEISASGVVTWAYENSDEINIICPGKSKLSDEWSDFQKNLPGAPDVDGEFTPGEYIDATDPTDSNIDVPMTCANSGGAASLGWIVCPLLEWMGNAADKVYTEYVEPSLQIEPQLFSNDKDQGTRFGWGVFQGIANVLFVILFMVVIFSQLTGYGIDNYGIKKILPKLIVVAILVNLSYYICLICVDLSNILGNGLQALFDGLPINGSPTLSIPDSNISGSGIGATALTGVAVLGILVLMVGAVWQNPAILLSLLVAALGVVIAIFFLFVLLAAREAAIVILVVISPVAFICYMLPNTKKLFDKWLKFGEGLLLVYPIAGALVGGGDYVSRLLLSSGFAGGGFIAAFTAMIVGVLPIFFIPTVLKGAFAAMGSVGAKLSGLGDRMRGGATRGIRNSNRFKNAQERGLERRTRINAGLNKNGEIKEIGKLGRFLRGGKRNMARSRAQYLKNQDMHNREDSLMGVGFNAAMVGQTKKAEAEETANYMTLINDKTRNGEDETALLSMYDDYISKGNKAGAVAVARIAGRRKDTAASFLNKRITGYGLSGDEARRVQASNFAHSDIFRSVAKEISTGENSRMYRESTPLGFEFAAQYNRSGNNIDYTDWSSNGENIGRAVDNYITNSQELVGAKNSSLGEIAKKMEDGTLDEAHVSRLRNLARETINNRAATGIWDSTKAENIYRIAGMEMPRVTGTPVAVPATTPSTGTPGYSRQVNPVNIATEGESFDVRGTGETTTSPASSSPSSEIELNSEDTSAWD